MGRRGRPRPAGPREDPHRAGADGPAPGPAGPPDARPGTEPDPDPEPRVIRVDEDEDEPDPAADPEETGRRGGPGAARRRRRADTGRRAEDGAERPAGDGRADSEGADGDSGGEPGGHLRTGGTDGDLRYNVGRGRAERRRAARRIKRRRRSSAAREVPVLIGVALLIALVLKTFLVQAFVIPSGSMEETIRIGDRVLVDKLTPWFGAHPHRGDVIVFRDPGHWLDSEPKPAPPPEGLRQVDDVLTFIGLMPSADDKDLIKRVVAVGGDEVKCCDAQGRIMVNGKALDEPYVAPGNPPSQIRFDVKVPPGRLWVMGDHRSDSADSRYHMNDPGGGTVPENLVVGKAFVIAWPVSHWRRLQEPGTFASVPEPGANAASAHGTANNGQDFLQHPTPAELPFVTGLVGLYRVRRRRSRRSEEWKWGTLWSAHGPDPVGRRTATLRSALSRRPRRRPR